MIQWFPGHMAKAINQIKEKQVLADIFIITLDARAPISSYNEEFDSIAPSKPRLFIITKKDLGDQSKLSKLESRFNNENDKVLVLSLKTKSSQKKILKAAQQLLAKKRQKDLAKGLIKPRLRAIVIGVPNSGKSTLINLLANKASAKVGNMPGVTKGQQWVNAGEIQLLDTPGILWPKFENELIGVKLAIIGSIKMEVIPKDEIFNQGFKLLSKYYPEKIINLGLKPQSDEKDIYAQKVFLAQNKKFLMQGSKLDLDKAHNFFIKYLRDLKGVTYD